MRVTPNYDIKAGTMSVYETILKRRSIRRFQNVRIPYKILEKCVNAARLAPSARNLQPWEFIIVDRKDLLDKVFDTLGWADYITPRGTPPPGGQPKAYIVILANGSIRPKGFEYDIGMAATNIVLVALENGVGSCCFADIRREQLKQILNIPDNHTITLVIALGYPDESPVTEDFVDSVKFWRDEQGTLHVPKRKLADILYRNNYGQC